MLLSLISSRAATITIDMEKFLTGPHRNLGSCLREMASRANFLVGQAIRLSPPAVAGALFAAMLLGAA
jgi:hypothetical protein